MKFGESLSEGLVPEWRDQYFNYKLGKKAIKKIKQLKDESTLESLKQDNADDRTPLLVPPTEPSQEANYSNDIVSKSNNLDTGGIQSLEVAPPKSNQQSSRSQTPKKTSIFNYSLKSNKEKKNSFETEKDKFIVWLDSELFKVDNFYKEKEQEAYERFLLLQDQLYQLRDHKSAILREQVNHKKAIHHSITDADTVYNKVNDLAFHTKSVFTTLNRFELPSFPSTVFLQKWKKESEDDGILMSMKYEEQDHNFNENRIRNGITDFNSDENDVSLTDSEYFQQNQNHYHVEEVPTTAQLEQSKRRDYIIKKQQFDVPYLYARKQLKKAILEYYRALSLLRSYKDMNRTAFRKITKKFDKTMDTSISSKYMKKLDTESYFQTTDVLDKIANHVEELYIAFFDPDTTDIKRSLEKLKSIAYAMNNNEIKQPSYYAPFFASGFFIGFGIPLFALGLYTALHKTLIGKLPEGRFLLQLWAGFFLLNLILLLFGVNLLVFDYFKINYKFIFEFNMTSVLSYKQFWLLPSFGFGFLSILAWFSFQDFWPDKFPGRDWPWIYFGIMLTVFLWPGNSFYASSRKWLQIALWRLLLSGFYPVEFRDFFLGDILCSLTYTMGNIPFFFCLYAHNWNGLLNDSGSSATHNICGSSKSRLMGFFSSLPSIWRFLQCVRRYMDTGDWFPHLANMLKYTISALYYCFLSVYRIHRSQKNRATFIIFAFINSVYSSAWDVIMDWSLFQSNSKNKYLRDNLFFKNPVYYYFAVIIDITLRFPWIFYVFFSNQIQQSAVTSFCIALAEVIRRFIWVFFRMENEHCTNVILFRASRDSPLPYPVSSRVEKAIKKLVELKYNKAPDAQDFELLQQPTMPEVNIVSSRTTSINQSIQPPSERGHISGYDEEADLGITRFNTDISTAPRLSRRKSTFSNFNDVLNKAHIKDFQRRKTAIQVDDESEDDDDEEEEEHITPDPVLSSRTTTRSLLPSVRENESP